MAAVVLHSDEIRNAYEDVRNDKTETNWLLLGYTDGKDNINVEATGSGGLSELVSLLKEDQAQFGFVRYVYSNDPLSQRAKFVFISWVGPQTKVMRKAKVTVQLADVKSIIKNYAVEIQADDIDALNPQEIEKLIKKAGGANYDRQASSY